MMTLAPTTPTPEQPLPEHQPPTAPLLAPWQTALLGLGCGLLTGLATEYHWDKVAPVATYSGLSAAWAFSLGAAYLGPRWGGLLVVALATALSTWALTPIGESYRQMPLFPTSALALAGLCALQVWGRGNKWQERAPMLLPWLVQSLVGFELSGLLGGLFVGLAFLAAALAKAAGFGELQRALAHQSVILPLFFGAAAFFVGLLQTQTWARNLTRTLANVLGFLAPFVSLIMLGFLALLLAKVATGSLGSLYDGMLNSSLYLSLSVAALLLSYCAFHLPRSPLPTALQTFTRISAYALPFFPALSLYGLWTRAGQYGLTESRIAGLMLSVVLLVATLSMALTRWRPAFAGLWRSALLLAAALGVLGAVLSLPGLRPIDLSVRSQVARLSPQLTSQQSSDIISALAYRSDEEGKAALRAVPDTQLSSAAKAQRSNALSLKEWQYGSTYQGTPRPTRVKLDIQPRSAPLTAQQQATLRAQLTKYDPRKYATCRPNSYCEPLVFVQAPTGGRVRVLVMNSFYETSGDWYELSGDKVVAQGIFGKSSVEPRPVYPDGNNGKNPFVDAGQDVTVTKKGVQFGDKVFILEGQK